VNKLTRNRMIGAGCCISSGFALFSSSFLKDSLPYSGIIGWSLGVILIFCAMYFFGGKTVFKNHKVEQRK